MVPPLRKSTSFEGHKASHWSSCKGHMRCTVLSFTTEYLLRRVQGNSKRVTNHRETYGIYVKILFAFLAGFAICPMGFSGSFVDGLVAGASSAFLMIVQLLRGGDVLFTGIFQYAGYSIGFLCKLRSLGHCSHTQDRCGDICIIRC